MDRQERAILSELCLGGFQEDSETVQACHVLYRLARGCPAGTDIVHLGAGNGCASIALAFGSRAGSHCPVYGIDPTDANGMNFLENVQRAGIIKYVRWVGMPYRKAARKHGRDVGLLVWDTGEGPKLLGDFRAWRELVLEGGLFAVHGNRVAFPMLVDCAAKNALWMRGPSFPEAQIYTIRRLWRSE